MIRAIRNHVARGEDFAFETTLAGRRYAREIPKWRAAGYRVGLIFLALPSVELALSRIAERVRLGGHSVAEDVVRRRFAAGRENFERIYKGLVDEWWLYDNADRPGRILDQGGKR
jgi:predicted ABC-type ATPase